MYITIKGLCDYRDHYRIMSQVTSKGSHDYHVTVLRSNDYHVTVLRSHDYHVMTKGSHVTTGGGEIDNSRN